MFMYMPTWLSSLVAVAFCLIRCTGASRAAGTLFDATTPTCNLTGNWTGTLDLVTPALAVQIAVVQGASGMFTANAPGYWLGARGQIRGDAITGSGGWTNGPWVMRIGRVPHDADAPPCSALTVTPYAMAIPSTTPGVAAAATTTTTTAWCRHDLAPSKCAAPMPGPPGKPFNQCPHGQLQQRNLTGATFGEIYSVGSFATGVSMATNDLPLQTMFDKAEACERNNSKQFLPGLHNVVEGQRYTNAVWLETQPMAGALWATRNVTQALANQLIFMRTQRADGRLSGMVQYVDGHTVTADYCIHSFRVPGHGVESILQGNYFSTSAVDVAFFLGLADAAASLSAMPRGGGGVLGPYVRELNTVLERFDSWLWRARSGQGSLNDTLWCASESDWGGDGYDGYLGHMHPITSMDMMAYAHSNSLSLARTATLLGNASGAEHWAARAAAVRAALERVLWDPLRGACYDVDATGKVVDVLVHNNLRAMWHGAFSQRMADVFVAKHLRNTSEFWTPFPLPSISASDTLYVPGIPKNEWSGPAEGLTYQRATRALANYGYHAEVTLLGHTLLSTVAETMRFPQQWNPQEYQGVPAGAAGPGDCYGPALLSVLDYAALAHGIVVRPADAVLQWSSVAGLPPDTRTKIAAGISPSAASSTYNRSVAFQQRLGSSHVYTLTARGSTFVASHNGVDIFECTRGVRVLTALKPGAPAPVIGVVGISPIKVAIVLKVFNSSGGTSGRTGATLQVQGVVHPNAEYSITPAGQLKVERQVPFSW